MHYAVQMCGAYSDEQCDKNSINYCLRVTGKAWKRMVTKVCYVGEGFTRKPPKYERFIRPMVRRI